MAPQEPWRTATGPEARRHAWLLHERVVGVRVFGTSITYKLPATFDTLRVGSGAECELRFLHPTVSRLHALLHQRGDRLTIDEATPPPKNGCFCEGERRLEFQLLPGTWFALGGLELVAYSHESETVRGVLSRYLGFSDAAQPAIDRTYFAATRERNLALIGPPGATMPLARAIVEEVGDNHAIQVAPKLSGATLGEQMHALKSASRGTLIVPSAHLPSPPDAFFAAIQARTYEVRMILLVPKNGDPGALVGPTFRNDLVAVVVPGLAERPGEMSRLLQETIADQSHRLQATSPVLRAEDLERLQKIQWSGHCEELEMCVQRLVAVRLHGSIRKAAPVLGLKSASTLSTWAKQYGFKL